ncbi:SAM-dependent methyltransferase [Ammoniphilus oxalaticus]|uniref:SAM-dependent methyltransferase n=1 Tax=Ammoniphilus oxalaticus TaxID=66863 RepID=A0A419SGQ4_9BACL|nr:SAM-dependent methyltransferase [Ammoniphilus oxalaticus]RKD22958.1 SAM-dependent methyltransferase [Ammoniphilus oxalaticus]
MEKLQQLITELIEQAELFQATLSNPRKKDSYTKVEVKPVELKDGLYYQFSYHYANKVIHDNLLPNGTIGQVMELVQTKFRQVYIQAAKSDYQVLISKKFKVTILNKKPTRQQADLTHNRKKNYLIEEGRPVPFLQELGVMNAQGKVFARRFDKFRQINRFVEMIRDIVPHLKKQRQINIVDFGCGKSYLTFALYHYLHHLEGLDIRVIGLDLKEDVIRHCDALAQKLGYEQLKFQVGDINEFEGLDQVDMVVTLHACDTATDAALEKAVRWDADVILSVPCCQHELMRQVENETMAPMLKHGIIKERFSALATDSIRAQLLEIVGYRTQLLEFIDLEHTPKNLLIRAVKGNTAEDRLQSMKEYKAFKTFMRVDPFLEHALEDVLEPMFHERV